MSLFLYQDGSRPRATRPVAHAVRTFSADISALPKCVVESSHWDASLPVRGAVFLTAAGVPISNVDWASSSSSSSSGDGESKPPAVTRLPLLGAAAALDSESFITSGAAAGKEKNGSIPSLSWIRFSVGDGEDEIVMKEVAGNPGGMCAACRMLAVAECGASDVVAGCEDDDETMDSDSTSKGELDASLRDWVVDALERKLPTAICAHFSHQGNAIPPCVASVSALGSRHLLHGAQGSHPMLRFAPVITGAGLGGGDGEVVTLTGRCLGGDVSTRVAVSFRSSAAGEPQRCLVEPLVVGTRQLAFRWPAEVAAAVACGGGAVVCEVCVVVDRAVPGARAPPVRLASEPIVWRIDQGGSSQGRVDVRPSRLGARFMGHVGAAGGVDLWRAVGPESTLTSSDCGDPLTAVVTGGFVDEGVVLRTLRQGDLPQWCAEVDTRGYSNLAVAMYLWPAAVCYPLIAQCEADLASVTAELESLERCHGLAPASMADRGSAGLVRFVFAARDADSFVEAVESGRLGDLVSFVCGDGERAEISASVVPAAAAAVPAATAISKGKGKGKGAVTMDAGQARERDSLMARYMRWMMA